MRIFLLGCSILLMLAPVTFGVSAYLLLGSDHDKIVEAGKSVDGTITKVSLVTNVTVNGEHPSLITFRYEADGTEKTDEETVWLGGATVEPDQKVDVKYLGKRAVLPAFKPMTLQWLAIFAVLIGLPISAAGLVLLIVVLVGTPTKTNTNRF